MDYGQRKRMKTVGFLCFIIMLQKMEVLGD